MQSSKVNTDIRDPFIEFVKWSSLDVNENANKYMGPGSFFSYLLEEYMKRDILGLLPSHILKAHRDGLIYIHKLPQSIYIPYCTGHSMARLLEKGLKTPTVISRPARHFDTFVDHVANYLITLQHYFTGAQAFSSVEWYAGPFIRSDGLDYRGVKQNIQRLLYNLNYPTRIGLQTPFTNFTIIMDASRKALEGDYAVYDGKKTEPLGAYEKEAKIFLLALFENYMNGDSVGQPFTFPIPTLMTTSKLLWEDPEIYEAVFKTAAKRGSFYWLNTRVVDPDASYAMCLHSSEKIPVNNDGEVHELTMGELVEKYAGGVEAVDPDGATWYKPAREFKVLAFNPETGEVSWRPVKRILVKKSRKAVRVQLSNGRGFVATPDHPVLVYRRNLRRYELRKANDIPKDSKLPVLQAEISGEYVKLKGEIELAVDEESLSIEAWKHQMKTESVVWVSIKSIEEMELENDELFVDVEVDGPHYFVHSGGVITHNCCRLSIQKNELLYAYNGGLKFSLSSIKKDVEEAREEYWNKLEKQRFGGLWAMPDITGSVNVVDINLPRLALEARGNDTRFWELYDDALKLVREAVNWFRARYVKILKEHPNFYYMITEYMPEFPSSHFNTIGLIGLPEAAAILMQEPKLWLDGNRGDWLRATELMRKIVEHATNTARRWMQESGTPWNVEEVPAESASPKMATLDMKLYPELADYLPDPDNPVYSTSIAPYYAPEMELPDRIEVEARVQKYFTGGVMMHIFLAEEPEPDALAKLAKRIMNTDIVYWSFTPALTYCPSCGRTYTGLYKSCPRCGNENIEVWSRIIGYYRPIKNWNPQRRKEFWTRHHYAF
ncbi:anaerobic ribonucleoside triphosphate reductase [Desulfurococcus amylolyticus]|uniref:Anaerobic ribonucleoside-triphosphate reductase n=1 Tax=Desulfurococcus amylolyticus DSM 16532 TaxID=768672 RepID=I3XT29_DESAM|nr:anaerobic ribonucleoside triphosphate reductase [Desulfurococcus amylolyticus]AFL67103.1 anaerobic ribonucleoside-triphosphate reductase [Desulfurococcus amylolyticus DSM 16532]